MAKKSVHVTPHPDGGHQVKTGGAGRAYRRTETQAEAIEIGRQVAINQGAELKIHGMNGRIRESNSYGNDPFPPKG